MPTIKLLLFVFINDNVTIAYTLKQILTFSLSKNMCCTVYRAGRQNVKVTLIRSAICFLELRYR